MEKEEAFKMIMLLHVEYERLKEVRMSRFFEEGADKYMDGQVAGEMSGIDRSLRIIRQAAGISHAEYMEAATNIK
ncbi:hypothetical protein MKX41_10805 [Paenibacillus sp. FSL R5-0475]|uniref:hypothetical protein n=1 Tax=Paenibacillus sp. FSL R5-0475 TaxID=2921643 RepID=UPI0030F6A12F